MHRHQIVGVQWLSGRVLDLRPTGCGFEPHRCHCVLSLSKNINPNLVLVQPTKTCPFITEILLMGRKESNQKISNMRYIMGPVKHSFLCKIVIFFLTYQFKYMFWVLKKVGSFEYPQHVLVEK